MQGRTTPYLVAVAVSLAALVISGLAFGSSQASGDPSLTWRDVALGAIGIVSLMGTAFLKGQQSRVNKLEEQITKLVDSISIDTATRAVESHRLGTLENAVRAVHRRLDNQGYPARHNGFPDDDGN